MEYVTSLDGTRIAYRREGTGPPLVAVHGTASDGRVWDRVRPRLADHFTVYAMDRRGRGESGDADDYAIEREFEDVVALADAVDGAVSLLGHSYGALCALGAAPRVAELRRLVAYEPPLWTPDREPVPADVLERMEAAAEREDREAILESFFRDVAGGDRLEMARSHPTWEMRVRAADTMPREIRARESYRPDDRAFAGLTAPTLLLLGSESSEGLVSSTEAARELLPDSAVVTLDGAGHAGIHTHPGQVASAVVEFLGRDRS